MILFQKPSVYTLFCEWNIRIGVVTKNLNILVGRIEAGSGSNSFLHDNRKSGRHIHQNCIFRILVIGGSISPLWRRPRNFWKRFPRPKLTSQIWDWNHLRVHMGPLEAFSRQTGRRGRVGHVTRPSLHLMVYPYRVHWPTTPLIGAEMRVEKPRPREFLASKLVDDRGSPRTHPPNGWMSPETRIKKYRLRVEEELLRTSGKSTQLKFISLLLEMGKSMTCAFASSTLFECWHSFLK